VVDETTAIILRVDPQGVIRFANQRALEFFGFTADELVGRHANDTIVPPQETTGRDLTALVQQIAADPDRFHQNANENIRKNGERVWLEWTNSGIYDAEGQLVEFLSVGIDATARKQAEEALQESEARFRGIVETAEEGIATHAADGTIIYVNQRMADMLGYAREEIIGRSSLSFLDEDEQQDVKHARARMQHEGNFSTERRMRRKDGSVLWTISNISPQRDSTGALLGYLAMHTDITARKQTEEALRESEEQFRRAILDAPIPIIMHAEDGEVLQVSRTWTEMTGYALSDVPTLDAWLNRAYGDGADAVRDHMHALFTGDQHAITVEFPISTRDGQVRHWSFSASAPGTLRDGRRFVVGMAVDITERKQYVQALLDHDRAKDELLAVISHELQTPLTSMLGWSTEALLAGDPGLMAQAMQVVHRNAVRQKRLIGDLLDISRLIHHKLTLEPAPLELNEQARQAVENISSQAQERELRLTFTPCPTPLPVHADPARLQQCLDNLLSNSLKFTDAGGTIDVCCWREGDEAVVAVRDSGRGIAPAALPTIFQLFEQVNRDERAGGLGLGLAITQRLVEMHQGRIHAESDGLGHGSRFVITLPLAPADRDATIAAGCAPCQSCG
jgi:PAS domain S-box-containing protein